VQGSLSKHHILDCSLAYLLLLHPLYVSLPYSYCCYVLIAVALPSFVLAESEGGGVVVKHPKMLFLLSILQRAILFCQTQPQVAQ
jgi:hypothetical protein